MVPEGTSRSGRKVRNKPTQLRKQAYTQIPLSLQRLELESGTVNPGTRLASVEVLLTIITQGHTTYSVRCGWLFIVCHFPHLQNCLVLQSLAVQETIIKLGQDWHF